MRNETHAHTGDAEQQRSATHRRERALQQLRAGRTVHEVAASLGVDRTTVWRWSRAMQRLDAPRVDVTAQREQALCRIRSGDAVAVVARELGVSRQVVTRWVREAGLRRADQHARELADAVARAGIEARKAVAQSGKWTSPGGRDRQDEVARLKKQVATQQLRQARSAARAREHEAGGFARLFWELAYACADLLPDAAWPALLAGDAVEVAAGRVGRRRVELSEGQRKLMRLVIAHRRSAELTDEQVKSAIRALERDTHSAEESRVRMAMGRSARIEMFGDDED